MHEPVHRGTHLIGAIHDEVAGLGFLAQDRRDLRGLGALGGDVAGATDEAERDRDGEDSAQDARIAQRGEAAGDEQHEEREHDRAVARLERAAREIVQRQRHYQTRAAERTR